MITHRYLNRNVCLVKMSKFATLQDDDGVTNDKAQIRAKVVAKFCSLGLVSSAKWFSGYIVIQNGTLKLYDHEDTVQYSPKSTVLEIPLDRMHRCSAWKRKKYKQGAGVPTDFFSFYIMKDHEWLGQIRELKIGSHDFHVLEDIMRCVEYNTRNTTTR